MQVTASPLKFLSKKRKKMANDNHLSSVTCYNVTMTNNTYYNEFFEIGQQKINFSLYELGLPEADPVYTLKKVMEELDYSGLLSRYSDKGRKGYNPIMLYAVVTYAVGRRIEGDANRELFFQPLSH